MRIAAIILASFASVTLVYFGLFRPWHLRWGSRREERRTALPGDEFILEPRAGSTRAITIQAPVELVWPWLAQMGQGRGGLYSYDWLENLFGCDVHSADCVIPHLQEIAVGDTIRLVKEDYPVNLAFEVAFLHPSRALVMRAPGEIEEAFSVGLAYPTWALVLAREDLHSTRLISRWRTDFKPTIGGYFFYKYGPWELVSFFMERKMLKGIRKRAERWAWRLAEQSQPRNRSAVDR